MLRLAGITIDDDDARDLLATLVADGGPNTTEAAQQIGRALAQVLATATLSNEQRDAILNVLEDPPPGLVELRDALARDHAHRLGAGAGGSD